MTPASVLTNCRAQLYETTATYWTDAELYGYMWYGERELAQLVPCTEAAFLTATVTDTSGYTSPSDILYYDRVTYDSVKLKRVDQTDVDALNRRGYGASSTTGQPTHYYEYGKMVYVWPIPQEAADLKFWYFSEPAEVTAAATDFTVPSMFQSYLQDYVLYRAWAKDDNEGKANFFRQQWENDKQLAYNNWAQRGQRDGYRVVRDVDNYPETQLGMI